MKLALLLFGISKQKYLHWELNKHLLIDYNYSYENYKKFIFDFFEKKGYDIDVYFTTNMLDDIDRNELCDKYKPVDCSFIENNSHRKISRNQKLDNVIDLCIENKRNYVIVLITRFDLIFKKDFNKSNINFDKFNLVSNLELPNTICDNFYLFPYKYLLDFSKIVKKTCNSHGIKKDIENIQSVDFVNYILNENRLVRQLSFYKIVRRYA